MKRFMCEACGHIFEGKVPPEVCPLCLAPGGVYIEPSLSVAKFADEHKLGVAQDAGEDIIEALRSEFLAECCETGMYIAMARQADREGYPEVAEAYHRIAMEEAMHAARYAEMLGENLSSSTRQNLETRFIAEHSATYYKLRIANKAMELNYDAIHDSVHEMCKDEARHGMAFKGLLERHTKAPFSPYRQQ